MKRTCLLRQKIPTPTTGPLHDSTRKPRKEDEPLNELKWLLKMKVEMKVKMKMKVKMYEMNLNPNLNLARPVCHP